MRARMRVFLCVCLWIPPLQNERTVLREGVTDEGLRALASARCGENLTWLNLSGD